MPIKNNKKIGGNLHNKIRQIYIASCNWYYILQYTQINEEKEDIKKKNIQYHQKFH